MKPDQIPDLYRRLAEALTEAVFITDLEGRITFANGAAERLTSYPRERLLSMRAQDFLPHDYVSVFEEGISELLSLKSTWIHEIEIVDANGSRFPVETRIQPIESPGGEITGIQIVLRSLRWREALRERERIREERLESLIRFFGSLALESDLDRLCFRIVDEGRKILGFDRMSLWFVPEGSYSIVGTYGVDEQGNIRDERGKVLELDPESSSARLIRRADQFLLFEDHTLRDDLGREVGRGWHLLVPLASEGEVIGILYADNLLSGSPIGMEQVELSRIYGATIGQLFRRTQAESIMRSRELYLKALSDIASLLLGSGDEIPYSDIVRILGIVSRATRAYMALNRVQSSGDLVAEVKAEWWCERIEFQPKEGGRQSFSYESEGLKRWKEIMSQGDIINEKVSEMPDGEKRSLESRGVKAILLIPLHVRKHWLGFIGLENHVEERIWEDQAIGFLRMAAMNISSRLERLRIRAERECLSRLSQRLVQADSIEDISEVIRDEVGRILEWEKFLFAVRRPGSSEFMFSEIVDREGKKERIPEGVGFEGLLRIMEPMKSSIFVWIKKGNRAIGAISFGSQVPGIYEDSDVNLVERVADLVTQALDRIFFEERLRQAQKMEAIGVLVGGIAHDFNNLLTAVLGNLELASMKASEEVSRYLRGATKASQEIASLVRQLMAYAMKAMTMKRPISLEPILQDVAMSLRKTADPRIEIRLSIEPGLWKIHADPDQIRRVIENLTSNAKDAIMDCIEGHFLKELAPGEVFFIDISAKNLSIDERDMISHPEGRPGQYVLISISDNGCGMKREVRERIFEPFFTTRGLAHRTGLGLAVVYGTVKQHDGWIEVDSELGKGTTFRIYLPKYEAKD